MAIVRYVCTSGFLCRVERTETKNSSVAWRLQAKKVLETARDVTSRVVYQEGLAYIVLQPEMTLDANLMKQNLSLACRYWDRPMK